MMVNGPKFEDILENLQKIYRTGKNQTYWFIK